MKTFRLCGGGGKFKMFSGLQMEIWKKLFTNDVHPPGRGSGANRLVKGMARLRVSRLSATEMGAARRASFCGSTVDSARRARDVAIRNSRRDLWPGGEDYDLTTTSGLTTSCNTQEPCLRWLRPCRSASHTVRVCHIFQRIFDHRCPRDRNDHRQRLLPCEVSSAVAVGVG